MKPPSPPSLEADPLDPLAEDFLMRLRRGERPELTEYTAQHPELVERIRKLFPALMMLEELGSVGGRAGGSEVARTALKALIPPRLGEYRILREVGRGGMGIVYEAVQESLGRHVALKVLPFHSLLGPTRVERFRREAQAAARLHHTNIVPVFGVGEQEGIHFYAMQFISGQGVDDVLREVRRLRSSEEANSERPPVSPRNRGSLAASVAKGLLSGHFPESSTTTDKNAEDRGQEAEVGKQKSQDRSPTSNLRPLTSDPSLLAYSSLSSQPEARYFRSVAEIGAQVADALAYAHREGVLHRDVKPSNLLLDTSGRVWVTDFGLAKAEDSDDLTQTGDMVGTLGYMAPERFQGQADPRSDVYGLGVTLYEMLTLRPAFSDSHRARLIERIAHEEPAAPRKLDGRIPRDLETIILKAMAKEPGARYPSAEALAQDLRRVLADRPIQARRVSSFERLWRWCRRNPGLASALGLVAASLLAVAVISTLSAVWLKVKGDQLAEAERKARLREAEALVGQARGTRLSHRPGQRIDALDSLGKAAAIGHELGQRAEWFDRLRNEAIAALALPDIHVTQEFPPGTVTGELSDDFELYVATNDKGSCLIHRVADGVEVARIPELGEPVQASFGPGRLLAVRGKSGRFQLWDVSGSKEVLRWELQKEIAGAGHFRPDGRLLGLSHTDGSVSIHDSASGARLGGVEPVKTDVWPDAALHPTEPLVAVCGYFLPEMVRIYDWRKGSRVAEVKPPWPGGSTGLAWCPDGRTLVVAQGDFGKGIQEYAFDSTALTLRPIRTLEGSNRCSYIVYNPAGDQFISRGWEGIIDLFDAVSGRLLFQTPELAASPGLRFDRSGQRLATARCGDRNDRIGLWSVADGREYRALVCSVRGEIRGSPAVHPRGRLAAIGWTDGVALFDLETGRELAHLPISVPTWGTWVTFDGTGNLLTNGFEGFFRWPVRPDPAIPERILIGPPQRLPFNPGYSSISASHDGQVIAQCMWTGYGEEGGAWILHPNSPQPRQVVKAGHSVGWCSVSTDGRWVAFNVDGRVNVYDAAKAQREWQLPRGKDLNSNGRFTPDGEWLVVDGRRYAVGSWEPGPQLGPGALLDVTSDLAVLAQRNSVCRLVELATARELARLENPEQTGLFGTFTPDGTKLIVAAKDYLRVWDLRRIRQELRELGLDWDLPLYPAPAHPKGALPLRVTLDMGDLKPAEQAKDYNDRAWLLATLPGSKRRDGDQAVQLAQRAVELAPKEGTYWNTLGAAHYRAGNLKEAVTALEKSMELRKGGDSFDWFFLAMAYWKLDKKEKARQWYAQAVQWMDRNEQALLNQPVHQDALERIRAEAAALPGIWDKAIADYSKAIVQDPKSAGAWRLRGEAYSRLGQFAKGVTDLSKATELEPGNDLHWYLSAAVYLYLGDGEGYRRTCRGMLERFGNTKDPFIAERTAKTCSLGHAGTDPERIVKIADQAVADLEKHPDNGWLVLAKAIAEYRAGRFSDSVAWLQRLSAKARWAQRDASAFAVLAMAQHRLGRAPEAHAALAGAQAILAEKMPDPNRGRPFGQYWWDWLHAEVLCHEAEELVDTNKAGPKDARDTNKQP